MIVLWSWVAGGFLSKCCKPHSHTQALSKDSVIAMIRGKSSSFLKDVLLTSSDRMGSPKELFGAKGTFYDMVQHSGEVKELQGVFGDSDE